MLLYTTCIYALVVCIEHRARMYVIEYGSEEVCMHRTKCDDDDEMMNKMLIIRSDCLRFFCPFMRIMKMYVAGIKIRKGI